jgi:hypothetical protein
MSQPDNTLRHKLRQYLENIKPSETEWLRDLMESFVMRPLNWTRNERLGAGLYERSEG